ncbi:MAG: metal-dependent hydrolase [Planctomycetota bacterium]
MTHAVTAAVACTALNRDARPRRLWPVAIALAVLPDADVISFPLGIDYGSFFGHRGFFHSIFFALVAATAAYLLFMRSNGKLRWPAGIAFLTVIAASHGILDACTNGGCGIALLSPFDATRYFFPWTPIPVSPIGLGAFLFDDGAMVILWEAIIVWLPLLAALVIYRNFKRPASPAE